MLANFKCTSCSSRNQRQLTAEIAFHFPGPQGMNKPIVLAFPEVFICLNCGFAVFALADAPLKEIGQTYMDDNPPSTRNLGGMWL